MGFCFICDTKLYGERTRVCTSVTPHSNVPYPNKIAELLGDEVVVIVTPADQMCKKCTSLLTHMDKLENDLKLVKNAILSYIQKKYGILPLDRAVQGDNSKEQVEQVSRCKVPSGLTVGVSPTVTTAAVVMPVQTPSKLLKTQQQPQQQRQQPPTQQESASKMKTYKCSLCTFQSKELEPVRLHMRRTHMNKKEPEKPIVNQAIAKTLTPVSQQKRRIFRCQVCSKSFISRINCLDHIKKDHNPLIPSTSNAKKGTAKPPPVTIKVMKPELAKTQKYNQKVESPMDVDKNHRYNNKATVDIDMLLNDYVPTERSAEEPEEENENSLEDKIEKEVNSGIKPESAEEEEEEAEEEDDDEEEEDIKEDTAVLGEEEAYQKTLYSIKKKVGKKNEIVENRISDLDIESMLAAIHNDNPTNN